MGYFSNGTEGMMYEERYCYQCIHGPAGEDEDDKQMCSIWAAHMFHNYDECNNDKSILHMLIPRSKSGCGNEQCTMFVPRDAGT